ncbi:claudin-4-like [Neolamprologus brichardi]|uniref:claudin-4-like n=1 Tax=Neolamprologus brichardi TaxID=32507 RepID=UPI0003EBF713|nr:claudin-4-like [Neolamprologus brichardi]
MADCKLLGLVLAIIGFLGSIITCVLPMWRVTPFIRSNIVTAQTDRSEAALWLSCVVQSTSQKQCKVYDSMLTLPQDLQASRALIIITILLGFFGMLFGVVGYSFSNCMIDQSQNSNVTIASGVIVIIASVLLLIPVTWTAHIINQNSYNPTLISSQRRELGSSLYIGWGSAGLLFLGGGLLCSSHPRMNVNDCEVRYSNSRPV